jgi:tRNA(Met) C34 N-acetyltransferase TmcA
MMRVRRITRVRNSQPTLRKKKERDFKKVV